MTFVFFRMYRWLLALLLLPGQPVFLPGQFVDRSQRWKTIFDKRLPLYGHRNWIVVADSAFPVYAQPGIETIVTKDDLATVLAYVVHGIRNSPHVRASAFLDREMTFIEEEDHSGVSALRQRIASILLPAQASSMPHSEVLSDLSEAGSTYRILFIKTSERIPYSSVFIRLDCGYMSDRVEKKIRDAMDSEAKSG